SRADVPCWRPSVSGRQTRNEHRVEKATFGPGEYGRVIQPDGTAQWWIRSSKGSWIALSHQRVMENEDGRYAGVKACVVHMPNVTFVSLPGLNHMEGFFRSDLVLPHVTKFLATVPF